MEVCKFRILIDSASDNDVFRDIEILESQTFADFNKIILESFGFSGQEMASFYVSNDDWDKGAEITLMDMGFDPNAAPALMDRTEIKTFLLDEYQKYVYVYDFLRMWCFYIELIDKSKKKEAETYPRVVLSFGEAPKEESKDIDFGIETLPDPDSDGPQSLDDEIGDMFDSLDDYEDMM